MASFIAKQLVGKQLDSVKGAMGKDEESKEGGEAKEMDPELQEALREAEEKRQEKHRKMEEERETMRQEIRDKYGLKKKEEEVPFDAMQDAPGGRLGRARKTPEELKAEAEAADEEDDGITSFLPENMRDIANKVTEGPGKLVAEASEKCTIQ